MNAPRRLASLPPAPPEVQAALRGALDVAFTLTTPDAVVIGPISLPPAAAAPAPVMPGAPVPIVDRGLARVAILVLHDANWRQRVLRRVESLLAEFTLNADLQLARDLADEALLGRPLTAQWLAAGTCVYDPLGRGRAVVDQAVQLLVRGHKPAEAEQGGRRVQALIDLNEARVRLITDPVSAELLLSRAIEQIIDFAFGAHGRWRPAAAERFAGLAQVDRGAAVLLEGCFQGYDLAARLRATERLADRVLGTRVAPDWIGPRLPAATSGL